MVVWKLPTTLGQRLAEAIFQADDGANDGVRGPLFSAGRLGIVAPSSSDKRSDNEREPHAAKPYSSPALFSGSGELALRANEDQHGAYQAKGDGVGMHAAKHTGGAAVA